MESGLRDLAAGVSHRMTGLDLGTSANHPSNNARVSPPIKLRSFPSSSDEMLTTPKFLSDSGGGLLSPRGFPAKFQSPPAMLESSKNVGGGTNSSSRVSQVNGILKQDDMLTTPVLTTPKTSDLWPQSAKDALGMDRFPPDNLSSPDPVELGPREPPRDLPMDSEIGLRSPCDGLLAKRRKFKLKQAASSNSVNSDSNSCDTPTSQNSPRDLSVVRSSGEEPPSCSSSSSSGPRVPERMDTSEMNEPVAKAPRRSEPFKLSQTPHPSSCDFKHPNTKPENLRFPNPISINDGFDLPSPYVPSPLAVPSPNWSVVERYLDADSLKTPKQLDSSVFDFLSTNPMTPRSAKFRDRSPGIDRVGWDQRLSPRLSPRFPIPETPTDLSSKDRNASSGGACSAPPPYPSEAEDLSMGASKAKVGAPNNPTPPPTIAASSSNSIVSSTGSEIYNHQLMSLKQEFPQQHLTPPQTIMDPRSRTPSGEVIKSEVIDDCDYPRHPVQGLAHPCFNSHQLYLAPHLQLYQRQLYGRNEEILSRSRLSPAPSHHSLPPSYDTRPPAYQGWGSQMGPMVNSDLRQSRPSSSQGQWHDEEHSVSPPASMVYASPAKIKQEEDDLQHQHHLLRSDEISQESLSNGHLKTKTRKKASKGKPGKSPPKNPNGTKRVYSCPHCQRSYEWNYNLNRHLKYECGKDNAFQCSKCGRKFPHKQNCVYHLKRKHKIECDTIDQYVTSGLVVFLGTHIPGGLSSDGSPPKSSSSA